MADNNKTTVAEEQKESGKAIKGTATYEKKSLGKKLVDSLFSDRIDSMFSYISSNIIWPSIKKLILDVGTNALQISLFGGGSTPGSVGTGNYIPGQGWQPSGGRREPFAYNQVANPNYGQPQVYRPPVGTDNVYFQSRDDANLVLDRLRNAIRRYNCARLADFYEASGVTGQEGNWALQGSGWYSIDTAQIMPTTDGRWIIMMPPVQPLR